jgi:hypothetical protein
VADNSTFREQAQASARAEAAQIKTLLVGFDLIDGALPKRMWFDQADREQFAGRHPSPPVVIEVKHAA